MVAQHVRVRLVRGLYRSSLESLGVTEALATAGRTGDGVRGGGLAYSNSNELSNSSRRWSSASDVGPSRPHASSWASALEFREASGRGGCASVRWASQSPAAWRASERARAESTVPADTNDTNDTNDTTGTDASPTSPSKSPAVSLDAPAASREYSGVPRVTPTAPADAGLLSKVVLFLGGYYSKQSGYMRAAKELNACVKEQAMDPAVLAALDIPDDSFQHRHAMFCLHVWMVLKRLRLEGKPGKKISQIMYDEFQDDVEHMVRAAGVQVRLGKHLSELEKQFYGSCTAYDRAMGKDAREGLEGALWRNVYQGEAGKEAASGRLARYVQRGVASLAKTPSEAVLEGRISFRL